MLGNYKFFHKKTVLPSKYSKIFYDFWWTQKSLFNSLLGRLKLEKDAMVLISGDTGSGKSNFVGNLCFKHAEEEPNFIMFEEFSKEYNSLKEEKKKAYKIVADNKNKNITDEEAINRYNELRSKIRKVHKENKEKFMFIPQDNFIISPEEFAYKMIIKEGQVLWGDEFRRGANRRDWYSPINKAILDRKNTNRKLFNIYFLCMPLETEFDPKLASHLHMWIWIRRGVGEVYVKKSGMKGGKGLDIQTILDREAKWLKENPTKTFVPPIIHPEYCGRVAFSKLSPKLKNKYKELCNDKKATGELTDEEKIKYGIKVDKSPKQIICEAINSIKSGEIKSKMELWNKLEEIQETDEKKVKLLNFYLKLEGWDNFNKLFDKKKIEKKDIW